VATELGSFCQIDLGVSRLLCQLIRVVMPDVVASLSLENTGNGFGFDLGSSPTTAGLNGFVFAGLAF
jgi:hypothetical protein